MNRFKYDDGFPFFFKFFFTVVFMMAIGMIGFQMWAMYTATKYVIEGKAVKDITQILDKANENDPAQD